MTAKLLWHFDIELDGDHETWVEDARFYVSTLAYMYRPLQPSTLHMIQTFLTEAQILWQLQPLKINLKIVKK